MTVRWHVNPKTGEAGKCGAEYQCPFGSSFGGHQNTKREASKMYEDYREGLFDPKGSSDFYFLSDREHEDFTQGDCGLLAAEIHRQKGYPVVAVGIRGAGIDDTSWDHIAVRAPDGRILDATGIRPESESAKAWNSNGKYEVVFSEIQVEEINSYLLKKGDMDFKSSDPKATAGKILEALRG